jgi:hypothetical protein
VLWEVRRAEEQLVEAAWLAGKPYLRSLLYVSERGISSPIAVIGN